MLPEVSPWFLTGVVSLIIGFVIALVVIKFSEEKLEYDRIVVIALFWWYFIGYMIIRGVFRWIRPRNDQ